MRVGLVHAFPGFRIEYMSKREVEAKREPIPGDGIKPAPDQDRNFTARRRRNDMRVETGDLDKNDLGRNLSRGFTTLGNRIGSRQ